MDMMDMDPIGDIEPPDLTNPNVWYSVVYWYLIVAVVGFFFIIRVVNAVLDCLRVRRARVHSVQFPTRPANYFTKTWATLTAVVREASYPQFYVPIRYLSWMTPPPVGHIILLLAYWAVISYMMAYGNGALDEGYMERVGYRNAWIAATQMPFVYMLASRANVIALIVGTSYEKLNWLHRWVARTMFVTATVHGFVFYDSWLQDGSLEFELEIMPMIKYGFGAWGILLWMTITSFKPFRYMAYEIFVFQHILSAVLLLWASYHHIPSKGKYIVWWSIVAICLDRAFRLGLLIWRNIKIPPKRSNSEGKQWIGYQTQLSRVGDSMTVLTIKDVRFKWSAGQHIYLWLPRVGPLEAHPYTIASPHQSPETCNSNSIQLVVRAHAGFSKRLNRFTRKLEASGRQQTFMAFLVGPYGHQPRWDIFETMILISASTGASYTLPILESVLNSESASCTKRLDFLVAAKQGEEVRFYQERLHEAIGKAESLGIELIVHIAITEDDQLESLPNMRLPESSESSTPHEKKVVDEEIMVSVNTEGVVRPLMGETGQTYAGSSPESHIYRSESRPDIVRFIETAVEATGGETGVVVCGGQSLVAKVRTTVAKISDERAVHKGTGAQGIYLHVEEFCF
ncbi:ferric reductase like transmembrane component-domain-containing protein [Hypomontagnella monticulosa]|nr:ferric reductase like transmembrane component-domain-containing protein [Hypomontagnella monticulosa]